MPPQSIDRRSALRRLGTTTALALTGASGCINNRTESRFNTTDQSTSVSSTTQTPSTTPNNNSGGDRPTQSGTSPPMPDLGRRPYVRYTPAPAALGQSQGYILTSVRTSVAARHRSAFGDTWAEFSGRWTPSKFGLAPEQTHLFVEVATANMVRGGFKQSDAVKHFEAYQFTHYDSYYDYEIMESPTTATGARAVALSDGRLSLVVTDDRENSRAQLRALIDSVRGTAPRHFNIDEAAEKITTHLPQGVFTQIYALPLDEKPTYDYIGIKQAGQTILVSNQDKPTFRTVLQLQPEIDDVSGAIDKIRLKEQLLEFPLTDPEVVARPSENLVVMDDVGDLETVTYL